MKKKILVIYPNSFPISGAATNRIIAICLGLIEQGNEVKVLINRPTERKESQLNFQNKGAFKGIEFEYATKNIIWPSNKLLKLWVTIIGQLKTLYIIFKENKKSKINVIISAATYGYTQNFTYKWISKFIGAKLVHTIDEYPWILINREKYSTLYRTFYLKHYYKLFDGYIVMTRVLIDYYKKISLPEAKFLHIPMTVELERFEVNNNSTEEEYIAYCGGDKTGTKDGVDILIKAFDLIKNDFPNLNLYIIGTVHSSVMKLAEQSALNSRVKFLGFVERDKVPGYLMNAKALCLARPDNLQADGGFPTKLGEYLATGNPVIVTKVGEIPFYLEHGINAFIAEPDSIEDFASKIRESLKHKDLSIKVGEAGKRIAQEYFNYRIHGQKIEEFLNQL